MKTIFRYISYGVGIGSTSYLLFAFFPGRTQPSYTTFEIACVLVMSGLIGLLSLIFESDRLNWVLELVIHAVGTAVLVFVTGLLNNWFTAQNFVTGGLLPFIVVYALVWLVLNLNQLVTMRQINRRLKERH